MGMSGAAKIGRAYRNLMEDGEECETHEAREDSGLVLGGTGVHINEKTFPTTNSYL